MTIDHYYIVWDSIRDRMPHEIVAVSEDAAKKEFCTWYNTMVPVHKWEKRRVGRFFLFKCGVWNNGVKRRFVRPILLMRDWEVFLDEFRFTMAEPPLPAEREAHYAEYARICALDKARCDKWSNQVLPRRADDEVLAE